MNTEWNGEMVMAMVDELVGGISVRAYHPFDQEAVLWLHRHGHLHGEVEHDCAAFLADVSDAAMVSRRQVLVVEADGRVIGATAIDSRHEPVAHLRWLCIAPDWQAERRVAERLVEMATATARELGCLKLVVHTAVPASQVVDFFCRLGFVFSRERSAGGSHVIEFYLDLYARPPSRERWD